MRTIINPPYRHKLPQMDGGHFLTDGGLETTLIFHEGWELPAMEAFILLESARGRATLRSYYDRYLRVAADHEAGFVLETPTWRANPDWGRALGYDRTQLERINRDAVAFLGELRERWSHATGPIVLSGNLGPRGDGYDPGAPMCASEAEAYHAWQVSVFEKAGVDLVSAITLTNANEAIGFAQAAEEAGLPSVVSFTLETDGRLPDETPLAQSIRAVDAATGAAPAYYMINCAHPTHFASVLRDGGQWVTRLRGLRANASKMSHEELDNASELDAGNPVELAEDYRSLLSRWPHINVLGGCCGTDDRHVAAIAAANRRPVAAE